MLNTILYTRKINIKRLTNYLLWNCHIFKMVFYYVLLFLIWFLKMLTPRKWKNEVENLKEDQKRSLNVLYVKILASINLKQKLQKLYEYLAQGEDLLIEPLTSSCNKMRVIFVIFCDISFIGNRELWEIITISLEVSVFKRVILANKHIWMRFLDTEIVKTIKLIGFHTRTSFLSNFLNFFVIGLIKEYHMTNLISSNRGKTH